MQAKTYIVGWFYFSEKREQFYWELKTDYNYNLQRWCAKLSSEATRTKKPRDHCTMPLWSIYEPFYWRNNELDQSISKNRVGLLFRLHPCWLYLWLNSCSNMHQILINHSNTGYKEKVNRGWDTCFFFLFFFFLSKDWLC